MDKDELKLISTQIRDTILRDIMIQRTRGDIANHKMYMREFREQNLSLPEVKPIEEHEYEMDDALSKLFADTTNILIDELKYERFNSLSYLTLDAREKYYSNDTIFNLNQLAYLMRNLLIKRFESSFYSFNISI